MNVMSILRYSRRKIPEVVEPLSEADWDLPGVCGEWSTKQVVAHLTAWASYFTEFLSPQAGLTVPTPFMDDYRQLDEHGFNDKHGTAASGLSTADVRLAYDAAWDRVLDMATRIPAARWAEPGCLPWDPEGALEDFVVYGYYGHQYEHAAQIEAFHDRRRRAGARRA